MSADMSVQSGIFPIGVAGGFRLYPGRGLMQVCNVNQSVELAETDYPIVSHSVKGSKTLVGRFELCPVRWTAQVQV